MVTSSFCSFSIPPKNELFNRARQSGAEARKGASAVYRVDGVRERKDVSP